MSRFVLACVTIAAAAVFAFQVLGSVESEPPAGIPQPSPGEPAWTHDCLGTDDEPPGCP